MISALAIATILAGLASAGAGIAGSAMNYKSVQDTNRANIDMQNATNQMSMNMSNTAHQREMADLKAAGLNPVLTATGGNGAPVAALSSPKSQAPQVDMSGIGSAINGTIQSLTNMKMAEMIGENYKAMNQQRILADAPLKAQRSEYYQQMVNELKKHNAAEINSVINSPKMHKPKRDRKVSRSEWLKLFEGLD